MQINLYLIHSSGWNCGPELHMQSHNHRQLSKSFKPFGLEYEATGLALEGAAMMSTCAEGLAAIGECCCVWIEGGEGAG